MKKLGKILPKAFSLVEVTIALGILSFCLTAIVGLLPVGLNVSRDALKLGDSARIIGLVTEGMRNAQTTNYSTYTAAEPFGFQWKIGDPVSTQELYFGENQIKTARTGSTELVSILIHPPASIGQSGYVDIVVAWPASSAQVTWANGVPTVKNVQGFERLHSYF